MIHFTLFLGGKSSTALPSPKSEEGNESEHIKTSEFALSLCTCIYIYNAF